MNQLSDERGLSGLTNCVNQNNILSEEALRNLSKSLTSLIPKQDTASYEPNVRSGDTIVNLMLYLLLTALAGIISICIETYYKLLIQLHFHLLMGRLY